MKGLALTAASTPSNTAGPSAGAKAPLPLSAHRSAFMDHLLSAQSVNAEEGSFLGALNRAATVHQLQGRPGGYMAAPQSLSPGQVAPAGCVPLRIARGGSRAQSCRTKPSRAARLWAQPGFLPTPQPLDPVQFIQQVPGLEVGGGAAFL
ncbi:hypothetical protein DPEC_G00253910 [Dallia pectoralis]|uniref:Uncharacterized protein n=1 Tax=Dallia pectoralis TaxID=75939 RepID=A0ACC2FU42_DALPE|nr:hypothetical protein DPEC_G00253910 [Dallia pectoralis]